MKQRKIGKHCLLVILLLVISMLMGCGGAGGASGSHEIVEYPMKTGNILSLYNTEDHETIVLVNDRPMDRPLEGEVEFEQEDLFGTCYAALTDVEKLYLVKDQSLMELADTVECFRLSTEGNKLCYLQEGTLYLMDTQTHDQITIDEDVAPYRLAVSPNGESVLYTKESEDLGPMMAYTDGQIYKIADGGRPISISDSGMYIYYSIWRENDIYVSAVTGETKLLSGEVPGEDDQYHYLEDDFILNRDHTQLMYRLDEKQWFTDEGSDPKMLAEGEYTYMFIPDGAASSRADTVTYGADSLYPMIFNIGIDTVTHDLAYMNSDGEVVILDDQGSFYCDPTNNGPIYLDSSSHLCKYDTLQPGKEKELYDSLLRLQATPDGKGVYFTDENSVLYYQEGNKKPKKLDDDVDVIYMTQDNYCLYIRHLYYYEDCDLEPSLHYSIDGKESELINDDVTSCFVIGPTAYYTVESDTREDYYDVYAAAGGMDFQLVGSSSDYRLH